MYPGHCACALTDLGAFCMLDGRQRCTGSGPWASWLAVCWCDDPLLCGECRNWFTGHVPHHLWFDPGKASPLAVIIQAAPLLGRRRQQQQQQLGRLETAKRSLRRGLRLLLRGSLGRRRSREAARTCSTGEPREPDCVSIQVKGALIGRVTEQAVQHEQTPSCVRCLSAGRIWPLGTVMGKLGEHDLSLTSS